MEPLIKIKGQLERNLANLIQFEKQYGQQLTEARAALPSR
jgi:hypothetical protein